MAQTIRLTITPSLEKALQVLRHSTLGTLNTTELIKMAVGGFAQIKKEKNSHTIQHTSKDLEMNPSEMDLMSASLFHTWAKEDETHDIDNIAHPEKLKSYTPKTYV